MPDPKKSLLANFEFVVLDKSAGTFSFVKDELSIGRLHLEGEIGDGDVVIELTEKTVRYAEQKKFIQLS